MSLWEKIFFISTMKSYQAESGVDGFVAMGNYDQLLKDSFLYAILAGIVMSLLYYVLVGRITYLFARWYYWIIPLLLVIPLTVFLCTIAIQHFFSGGGLGLFAYDLILEPHDVRIMIVGCIYSILSYFSCSLLFKTRWFTIYHRHIPFPY